MVIVWIWQVLRITAKTVRGPAYLEMIKEIDMELAKAIKDFMRAVDVEALRLVKKSGKHLLS